MSMTANIVFLVISLFCVFAYAENVCGDWETYKEQKCIKLFSTVGLQSFADAEKTCNDNNESKLVSINFADKQDFLVNYLFIKNKIVDNIWLEAMYDNTSHNFYWKNSKNSKLTFTNWAAKNPKNDSSISQTCIQLHAEAELRGQWSNEPCTKKNLVVCEKGQAWSNAKMQEEIVNLMLNQVPVGFIYVQLPHEKEPKDIWPWMVWSDVSAIYDSTFFRVSGSKSASFGTVQEEFSPYIDQLTYTHCKINPHDDTCARQHLSAGSVMIPRSGWTDHSVYTAEGYDSNASSERWRAMLAVHTAPGEVRPRNVAVKVWKRTD